MKIGIIQDTIALFQEAFKTLHVNISLKKIKKNGKPTLKQIRKLIDVKNISESPRSLKCFVILALNLLI